MQRISGLGLVIFLLASVCRIGAANDGPQEGVYDVGVAKVDVTPAYPIRLSGFASRKTESEGVSQRIWAKALAIGTDSEEPVVLVTLDNLGVRSTLVNEVAKRLEQKAGIERNRFVLTFTHTHCAPKVQGAADNIFAQPISEPDQAHIDQYTRELTDAIERVALAALSDRKPSRMNWSSGTVTFSKNRRTAGGPVDHGLPTLVVRALDGTVRAVYTTYACHCVTLSHNLISGDWAGYAQDAIERKFPGAVALVSIGCGSDSNPISGVTGDKVDVAAAQGMQIADEIERLTKETQRPVLGWVQVSRSTIGLRFESVPSREQLLEIQAKGGPAGYNATTQLARLERGERIADHLDYPVQTLSFGKSLCMVFLAGEVCVDYAIRLRKELNPENLWLHGYSNDFGAYIPSERLLKEGGYGAGGEIPYFALPSKLQTGLERQIVDEVKRQVPHDFQLAGGTDGVGPRSPAASIAAMEVAPKLKVELVASEPLIADPVAIDFGPDGSLWVAMMNDYAHAVDDLFEQTGEIRRLIDKDGDGKMDEASVFLSGLRFPTDVKVWRNGVLVCDAPEVLYAEDVDGDGKADIRRVLLSGFATHNAQARVNSLRWDLDNWMVASCGLFGGQITNAVGKTVDLTSRDFRFHPDTGSVEPMTGRTQQGRARDDWGHWFGCDNGTLVRSYPVSEQVAKRNPFVAPPPTAVFVPTGPAAGQLFPAGDLVLFKLSGSGGRATAACGLDIYRDERLGADYSNNAFTCEPVNQLIHREVLHMENALVRGKRAPTESNTEFLRSTDQWFRPVQVRTGPDGALWVVDMYRYVIEHPKFIPDESKASLNVFAGQGLGRIYRVLPRDSDQENTGTTTQPRAIPQLAKLDDEALAQAMDTANGTVRDLIQQMLLWRSSKKAGESLQRIILKSPYPAARLSALCTLDGLQILTPDTLRTALKDKHPALRVHAIRIASPMLESNPSLVDDLLSLVQDEDFEVRMQLAISLASSRDSRVPKSLLELACEANDPYMTWAVMSSLNETNLASFSRLALSEGGSRNRSLVRDPLLETITGIADQGLVREIVASVLRRPGQEWDTWQYRALAKILDGIDRRGWSVSSVLDSESMNSARELWNSARTILSEEGKPAPVKKNALVLLARKPERVVGIANPDVALESTVLLSLIAPQQSVDLQVAAVDAVARRSLDTEMEQLMLLVRLATPTVKRAILDAAIARQVWHRVLVDSLRNKRVLPSDLDAGQRERLMQAASSEARDALTLLLAVSNSPRSAIVETWNPALHLTGRSVEGRQLYAKRCIACHSVSGEGADVGPNLAALTTKSAPYLLTAILDPNREVDGRYQSYSALTTDGRTVSGLLASESAASITIREQGGKDHVLVRSEVEEFKGTGKSAMPEGLEADMSQQDMADLISYVLQLSVAK